MWHYLQLKEGKLLLLNGWKKPCSLNSMFGELRITQGCVKIQCDSQSLVYLENHLVYYERKKHIGISLHVIRDKVDSREIVEKIALKDNLMDVVIKSSRSRSNHCLDLINFVEASLKDGERSKVVDVKLTSSLFWSQCWKLWWNIDLKMWVV